jgi:hypothetical protein
MLQSEGGKLKPSQDLSLSVSERSIILGQALKGKKNWEEVRKEARRERRTKEDKMKEEEEEKYDI